MPLPRFLLWDTLGAALWSATYLGLGYLFSDQLERALAAVTEVGGRAFFAALLALAAYVGWKIVQRRRFLRAIALDRITPEELHARLAAGDDVVVVDLRHPAELEADAATVPLRGAHRPRCDGRRRRLAAPRPRDRALLHLTDEATSARAALLLRRRGIARVRPLAGGFAAWRARGYPVETPPPAA